MVALPENSYDTNAKPGEFDRLPEGTYTAKIVECEVEEVSQQEDKGRCLKITWQVSEGEYEGRLFWQRLLMWFTGSEKTPGKVVEIANQQFAAVREATVGLGRVVSDTDQLLGINCSVTYGPQKSNPQYDEVKSVKPLGATGSAPAPQTRTAPPAAQNGGSGGLPWNSRPAA